ncbi:MAG: alpha-L-arabinofuranosidase [Muribaculum sp.]|nr:alpha-L-arabinofuranosidase [Muribaculum sp.]
MTNIGKYWSATAIMGMVCLPTNAQEAIYVDAGVRGHDINPSMYGIFFEEINHSGDGGLYAELIQNRGFEEQTLPGGFYESGTNRISSERRPHYFDLSQAQLNWDWDYERKKMTGWRVEHSGCGIVDYDVVRPAVPVHEATPNAMRLSIDGCADDGKVRLINSGYWGMALEKDAKYDVRFYINTSDFTGSLRPVIYGDPQGHQVVAEAEPIRLSHSGWTEYTMVLTPSDNTNEGCFALEFTGGDGTVYVDYVSLFPQDTYCGRKNGLRRDLAEFLAELHPAFMRWPGGCIVEGVTLENRVKWKETIGDPLTRPGQYDLWGYRSSWGLGYHEMLQFSEDAGMDFMFVGNAGLACSVHSGQFVEGADVEPFYIDIRDAIEYAIGDPLTNEWAALRAEAGHPEPFPLKYVEIGNENFTARYDANYHYIYNKLKAEYPQITFLNTMGIADAESFNLRTDMIDPHWYVEPDYFYTNRTIFDDVPRGHYDIYVGEYASNNGVGRGNMDAALSEAVFMMDMERNSDIVKMASYAPLIVNDNAPNWTCNLIWQHSGELFGRASYYTQKMFSENLPSYNIASELHSDRLATSYEGRAGVGTWLTSADFRGFKVSAPDGRLLYSADFNGARDEWTDMQGRWSAGAEGQISQSDASSTRCISLMNRLAFRDCVIEVEARKRSGSEGFLVVFGCDDDDWDHYYQFNVGGWNNTAVAIESVSNGGGTVITENPHFVVEEDRWYKLKVVCHEGRVEGYIDGQLYCSHGFGDVRTGRAAVHAGYDDKKGEIVLKVVNAESDPMPMEINVNAQSLTSTASVQTLKAASLWEENSFECPELIYPQKKVIDGVAPKMNFTFDPYSLTIIRIKGVPAASPMDIPDCPYSSEPRSLTPVVSGPDAWLKAMISEARNVMFPDVEGYDALRVAVEAAEASLSVAETDYRLEMNRLKGALDSYYRGLMVPANEVTEKIVNPHFEQSGKSTGWSGNPTVNEHVAEMFNTCFSIAQTVDDLPDGYYLVYFQGYYRNGSHPDASQRHADGTEQLLTDFVLNAISKPVVSIMSETHDGYWYSAPNTMAEAHAVFSQSPEYYANYLIAHSNESRLRIAFEKSKLCETDWFCFDNVRLFRVPTSYSSIDGVTDDKANFTSEARVYDVQGKFVGLYSELDSLPHGVYIVTESGRSVKVRR